MTKKGLICQFILGRAVKKDLSTPSSADGSILARCSLRPIRNIDASKNRARMTELSNYHEEHDEHEGM